MLPILILLLCSLSYPHNVRSDQFLVLHSPKAVEFLAGNDLPASQLKDVLSTALGFTVDEENPWPYLEIKSPFGFAEGLLLFVVPGISSFSSSKGISYSLIMDENVQDTWQNVVQSIEMRYPRSTIKFERIDLQKPNLGENNQNLHNVTLVESESEFLKTLSQLHAAVDQILKKKNKDGVPDLYVIELPNLAGISQLPGRDPKELLVDEMSSLSTTAEKVYNGKILVAAIGEAEEMYERRTKRQATKESPSTSFTEASINAADNYDEDFPVIFNIILWLSVALTFSLIAISMVIAGMDPGRDSIIYRMTSTRMKKDN